MKIKVLSRWYQANMQLLLQGFRAKPSEPMNLQAKKVVYRSVMKGQENLMQIYTTLLIGLIGLL